MAYVKRTWVDRDAENISGRALTDTTTGVTSHVTVALDEGEIYTEGTPFTAETFNDLEDRIEEGINSATGTDVSVTPIVTSGTNLATISVDETDYTIKMPNAQVTEIVRAVTSGVKIATFNQSFSGGGGFTSTELYAPAQVSEIDDTSTASDKTWSAQKINGLLILDVTNVGV